MTPDQALGLLRKYYPDSGIAYKYLLAHSEAVAELALRISNNFKKTKVDTGFVYTAAMVHDIGIFMTHAPKIGCYGKYPYLAHGYLGRELLEREGFPKHALVCERHVGVGLSIEDIQRDGLPLPLRDMLPQSIEEEIVCYADKFFSKNPKKLTLPKTPDIILEKLKKYGPDKADKFRYFMDKYGL